METSPFYRFYRRADFPLPFRTWLQLPRIPDYKNEYWNGQVHLTPRPRTCQAYCDLSTWRPPPDLTSTVLATRHRIEIRRLTDQDWAVLPEIFHRSFCDLQPLASWKPPAARRASKAIIEFTRSGRDGLLLRDACWVAVSPSEADPDGPPQCCGAAITALVPRRALYDIPSDFGVTHPEDPAQLVVPHLTWIFVERWSQRKGVASRLLASLIEALRSAGFRGLVSTCLLNNAPSLLWHWRNGFLLSPDNLAPGRA